MKNPQAQGDGSFSPAPRGKGWLALFLLLLLKLSLYGHAEITYSGDELVFWDIASMPIDREFFFSYRPFTVPLCYKLLGQNEVIVVAFQIVLSVVGWFVLAGAICRYLRSSAGRIGAIFVVMGISLAEPVAQWEMVIRSESMGTSLLVWWIGLLLEGLERFRRGGKVWSEIPFLAGFAFVTLLFSFCRDNHPYLLLLAALLLCPAFLLGERPRLFPAFLLPLTMVGVAGLHLWNIEAAGRWHFGLRNLLVRRVLPDEEMRSCFERAGMPTPAERFTLVGTPPEFYQPRLDEAPFHALDRWLADRGGATYRACLLRHPLRAWKAVYRAREELLFRDLSDYGPVLTEMSAIAGALFFSRHLLCLGGIVWIGCLIARKWSFPFFFLSSALFLGAITQAFIVFHGDAIEIARHALIVRILLALAAWITFLSAFDTLLLHAVAFVRGGGLRRSFQRGTRSEQVRRNLRLLGRIFLVGLLLSPIEPLEVSTRVDFSAPPSTLRVAEGHFRRDGKILRSTAPRSILLLGRPTWTDYAVEAVFHDLSDGGILVRARDEKDALVFILRPAHGDLYWHRLEAGGWTTQYDAQKWTFPRSPLHVRVTARGSTFTAFLDGKRVSSVRIPGLKRGRVGIYFCCHKGQGVSHWRVIDLR